MATAKSKCDKSESVGGGGDKQEEKTTSYSDMLRTNVRFDQRLKRNVLEITLEKTESDTNFDVAGDDVAPVARFLGIDVASHAKGYHIQYSTVQYSTV